MSEKNMAPEAELSELLKIRRDKLAQLQESGNDPFRLTKYDVEQHTADILEALKNG